MLKPKTDALDAIRNETAATEIRAKRDQLFAETVDRINAARWEMLSDAERAEWKSYRQALCDITKQDAFPDSVEWPKAPS